ncbi:MAG: TonB-dependent receptor, partial [Nitratireductor sp.]|nr:TonB-dependent receptor [Nitratireductor sp.]
MGEAQAEPGCEQSRECAAALQRLLASHAASEKAPQQSLSRAGVAIRVDGETVAGIERDQAADPLSLAQIDIRYDGLSEGGKVTVRGTALPDGVTAQVLGKAVPVKDGAFEASGELPPGDHVVNVRLSEKAGGRSLDFERAIHVPQTEWFLVGLADVTVGKLFDPSRNEIAKAAAGEFDPVYARGRAAFYLKGKVKGSTLITAAMDTRDQDIDSVFTNLGASDPSSVLRRLDPDDFYPVYGDDSLTAEDAPTKGKFYLRIENGGNRAIWGNFKTRIDGVELARYERGLYGGSIELQSKETTPWGGPASQLAAFAAQPGTLPSRDEMRGTGGSVYFLQRQDITMGSEQVAVEERDAITGALVSRRLLKPGTDYDMDYTQGIVLLKRPLASALRASSAVQDGSLGGNQNWLTATYEYTPVSFDGESYSFGGRAQAWLTDNLRAGVTAFQENTGTGSQTLLGSDLVLQLTERSWFAFEWAGSQGDTFGQGASGNGGLIFNTGTDPAADKGGAFRVKAQVDFAEVPGMAVPGRAGFTYGETSEGFNAPGRYNSNDERIIGAFVTAGSKDSTEVTARYDEIRQPERLRREGIAEFETRINQAWSAGAGLRLSQTEGQSRAQGGNGGRLDAGVRLTRHFGDDKAWIFGQGTIATSGNRERNDRIGIGAEFALTEKLSADGEISWGTSGIGMLAGLGYEPNATDRYNIGYRLAPDGGVGDGGRYDPFGADYGTIVAGARRKLTDQLTAYTEQNYDFIGNEQSLMNVFGVEYAPGEGWRFGASAEAGEILDAHTGDFRRIAVSGSANYSGEGSSAGARLEARFEDGIGRGAEDRNTFLATANWSVAVNPDWRFLAKIDAAISQSDESVVLDGDYVEASLGYAWRPVRNDRLNGLFRYTYLQDLPGPSQVNA